MFQRLLMVFMLLLFCQNCSESKSAREERLLNELQLASENLQKCLVAQREQGDCDEHKQAKEVALLTCVKQGIEERRIAATIDLGERAVKGNPRNSVYNVTNRYFISIENWSWTAAFKYYESKNLFTENCPNGYESSDDSLIFHSMIEVRTENGRVVDFKTNSSYDSNVQEGSYQHIFLYKMNPDKCYDINFNYPIVEAKDLESIQNKYFKPTPEYARNTNGRFLVLHIGNTEGEAKKKEDELWDRYQELQALNKELAKQEEKLVWDKMARDKRKIAETEKNIKRLELEIEKLSQEILKGI